jgi:hypothetical protein
MNILVHKRRSFSCSSRTQLPQSRVHSWTAGAGEEQDSGSLQTHTGHTVGNGKRIEKVNFKLFRSFEYVRIYWLIVVKGTFYYSRTRLIFRRVFHFLLHPNQIVFKRMQTSLHYYGCFASHTMPNSSSRRALPAHSAFPSSLPGVTLAHSFQGQLHLLYGK